MNILQRIKLTMYMAVRDILNLNATIVANLPGYASNFTTVQNNIVLIQSTGEQQEFDKSGISDNKKLLRKTLVDQAEDISGKMVAYANNVGNAVLLKEVQYSKSELNRSPDADLKNKAQCIYDRANSNVAALPTYGITAAILTTFLAAINTFNAAIPKIQEGIKDKKLTTSQLAALYDATDAALKNIDKIIEIVHQTQPNFYKSYNDNRKLKNIGSSPVSLKGLVTDAASGEGLKNVTLTIVPDGVKAALAAKPIVKKTADKGGFMVKSLAAGTYSVTVKKTGYIDQIVTVNINDGEMTVLEVQFVKK
jgi:hypothetical protein